MCSFVVEYGDVHSKCLLLEMGIIFRESGDQLDSQQLGILLVTWDRFLEGWLALIQDWNFVPLFVFTLQCIA